MEATESHIITEEGKPRRRRAVSTAELYAVLEALLPFARVEVDCLSGYVESFPADPDHAADAVRAKQGMAALDEAEHLIGSKSYSIRRQQRALQGVTTDG